MTSFVGADATKAPARLELREVLLDRLPGNTHGPCHALLRQMRLFFQQRQQLVRRFSARVF